MNASPANQSKPDKRSTGAVRRRSGRAALLKAISLMPEPFTCGELQTRCLALHPELKGFVERRCVPPALIDWSEKGLLERDTSTRPARFRRTDKFSSDPGDWETPYNRYQKFRNEIKSSEASET